MSDTLRRVTVHATGPHGPSEADLMLPSGCPLSTLLPSVVTAVVGAAATDPRGWSMSRLAGPRLDGALTLSENGVDDGEFIVLSTTDLAAPQRIHNDDCAALVAAADPRAVGPRDVAPWAGLAACLAAAVALVCSAATAPTTGHLWVAVALTGAGAAATLRVRGSTSAAVTACALAATLFATAAGSLAVPQAGWPATVLLAASAGLAMATALLRTACPGSIALGAVVAGAAGIVAVSVVCALASPPLPVVGAALTVAALVAISLAPKLAMTIAGIGPARCDVDDSRADSAHAILTSLITGWSGVAALGAALVAGAAAATPATGPARGVGVLFAAVVGSLLIVRRRVHVDRQRRIALGLSGVTALVAAGAAVVLAEPAQTPWVAAFTGAAGLAVNGALRVGLVTNPVLRRAGHALEYLLLVAVVPLAAWVSGVYSLVRGLSLS